MKSKNMGMGRRTLVGLIALILILAGGALLGPELLGYYRFSQALENLSAADDAHGDWPQLHQVCLPCHGNQGDSLNQLYPDLAGQPAAYLTQQMLAFANGTRTNPNMSPLAATMSVKEIEQLAAYFAAQPAVANNQFQPDPALRVAGEMGVKQGGCASCHGAALEGHDSFPRLADQSFDYLVLQLQAYRSGARTDPSGAMQTIAAPLVDEDIQAMAHYLSSYSTTSGKP